MKHKIYSVGWPAAAYVLRALRVGPVRVGPGREQFGGARRQPEPDAGNQTENQGRDQNRRYAYSQKLRGTPRQGSELGRGKGRGAVVCGQVNSFVRSFVRSF